MELELGEEYSVRRLPEDFRLGSSAARTGPDVDPDVARWSCEGIELSYGGETYRADFVVTGTNNRTFVVDVAEGAPRPPDWIELAAARAGHAYRLVAMRDFVDSNRLLNAKDLLRYGFYRCSLGDRVRVLAALDEMGSLTVAEALSAFRGGRPMASLAALILRGFLEIEMDDAPIGPETVGRRIRDCCTCTFRNQSRTRP